MSESSLTSVGDSVCDYFSCESNGSQRRNLEVDRPILANRGYTIGDKINAGTFATVRYAEKKLNRGVRKLAVKIIDKSKGSSQFIEKFLPRELTIWPELHHAHIIQVQQILCVYERIYVFMELAPCGSVIEYLQAYGSVNENTARSWSKGLCQALKYCHRRGIAHRDIKCDNLLLDKNMQVKVGDFGFCRICVEPKTDKKIFSETYCGSAAYVAPEVIQGRPYDPIAADVWSAGVCMYVILNNAMPFDDSNVHRMHKDQIKNNWRYSPRVEDKLSSTVKKLIPRLLEPNVLHRATLDQVLNSTWMKK